MPLTCRCLAAEDDVARDCALLMPPAALKVDNNMRPEQR